MSKPKKFKLSPSHPSQKTFLQKVDIYHASNFPVFFVVKAGIGFVAEIRLKDVSDTTFGYVWPTAKIDDMEFGYWLEQFIHWFYWYLNAPFRTGSGKSEWFLNLNPIVGGTFTVWAYLSGTLFLWDWYYYVLTWSFPFLWLDLLLWMIIFRLLRIATILSIFALTYFALNHFGVSAVKELL